MSGGEPDIPAGKHPLHQSIVLHIDDTVAVEVAGGLIDLNAPVCEPALEETVVLHICFTVTVGIAGLCGIKKLKVETVVNGVLMSGGVFIAVDF